MGMRFLFSGGYWCISYSYRSLGFFPLLSSFFVCSFFLLHTREYQLGVAFFSLSLFLRDRCSMGTQMRLQKGPSKGHSTAPRAGHQPATGKWYRKMINERMKGRLVAVSNGKGCPFFPCTSLRLIGTFAGATERFCAADRHGRALALSATKH